MSNALRITLMVMILLILVIVAGSLFKKHNLKQIQEYTQKIEEFEKKIIKIDEIIEQNLVHQRELDNVRRQVEKFDKSILEYDSPPVTYDYLLNILDKLNDDLVFDFNYSGQKQENGNILNSYLIKGSASLQHIYKLISHLEKQKPIYYVYDLALSAPELTVSDTINYSFMIDSVSEKVVPQEVNFELKDIKTIPSVGKLFSCGLLEKRMAEAEKVKKRNQGLLDPGGFRLIAIIDQKAIFRDDKGIFQIMQEGDQVKNGKLTNIDSELGIVTFTLDTEGNQKKDLIFNVGSGRN